MIEFGIISPYVIEKRQVALLSSLFSEKLLIMNPNWSSEQKSAKVDFLCFWTCDCQIALRSFQPSNIPQQLRPNGLEQ